MPAGLSVAASGGATAKATTPTSVTPGMADTATTITITPINGNPVFTFVCDQRADGSRMVLYNQLADTLGSIGTISPSSVARVLDFKRELSVSSEALPRVRSRGALGRPTFSTKRLMVRYRTANFFSSSVRPKDVESALGVGRAVDIGPEHDGIATRAVDVPSGILIGDFQAKMRARPEVLSADPERIYYLESASPAHPNDQGFDNYHQWSEYAIKADLAWGISTGSPMVNIAIIDTGADFNHPDLASPKITYSEGILNGTVTGGAAAAQDTDGHGTNVAGIAAADTNNTIGFAGTGYDSSLQIYKVFENDSAANKYMPSANSADVTLGIYDAVKHGAQVINMSLGTCQAGGPDVAQRDAITYALAHGVVVVAAAGNERSEGSTGCPSPSSTVDFPAAYDGVIAVGASALDDSASPMVFASARERVASYSNSGPGLSLVAPGGDPPLAESMANSTTPIDDLHWIAGLYSSTTTNPASQCTTKPACYAVVAGTSQATPHVSGVAALMLAVNGALSPAQIKSTLMATADDIGDPNEGAGRLNAYRALTTLVPGAVAPTAPTPANFVAFAYTPDGSTTPKTIDVTYPIGSPVSSTGAFRVADIPAGATGYKIGVWYDANGNGVVDAGDYFGSSPSTCSAMAPCTGATGIVVHPVPSGFVLQ